PVRVLTRDKARAEHWGARGADIAVADLGDPDSLAAANEGVGRVVLQLPLQYDFELHETYGRNAVDAAKAAGVEMVVLNTSAQVLEGTQVKAYRARQVVVDYLQASGIPNIVLRPTFYMEILLGPWIRPAIVENGLIAFPLPADFPMSWVSATELAGYAVAALDRPDLVGRTFDIGGPEALTGEDLASWFGKALGRTCSYFPITPDDYEKSLAPVFGATVAFEVASQVRCMIDRGSGAVDMTATAATFSVEPLPLSRWIEGHSWDSV
ncbi:MAG TPA: NmrA family NAD(P)-binding protein, partial [Cryptosporangiaceae bacterium]|nr:NmrA family NAD(P)-binding protein [Cryptosporangiaceae bacterium]